MSTSSASPHSSGYIVGNKPLHYFILALLLLLTLYCLSSAFSRGVANAWYFNAEFSLNYWAKKKAIKDKTDYDSTLTSIKKAQSLDPTHPHYAHMVGRIKHWGIDMGYEDEAELVDIAQWYLLATQLRPLWPDPWVDLLRLNNYLYGYTDETKYYIEQALSTGPYIDLVTVGSIQVWLSNWPLLSGKERELLFRQFDVATKQVDVLIAVLKFSKSINRKNLLCSQLKFNTDYAKKKASYLYSSYCLN
jgi:hypothetical protein